MRSLDIYLPWKTWSEFPNYGDNYPSIEDTTIAVEGVAKLGRNIKARKA